MAMQQQVYSGTIVPAATSPVTAAPPGNKWTPGPSTWLSRNGQWVIVGVGVLGGLAALAWLIKQHKS